MLLARTPAAVKKLDAFLKFNEYDILHHAGAVSAEIAKQLAEKEYEKFRVVQDQNFESDFDRVVKRLKTGGKSKKKSDD